jgi:hypothetical protein
MAAYRRSYRRTHKKSGVRAAGYLFNPAHHWTDQGAAPHAGDLAWCIRRRWRVIYYTWRYAAGLPLWDGVDDFLVLMSDVLFRLSSGFAPIAPVHTSNAPLTDGRAPDPRTGRVYQPSGRVFRIPPPEEQECVG